MDGGETNGTKKKTTTKKQKKQKKKQRKGKIKIKRNEMTVNKYL